MSWKGSWKRRGPWLEITPGREIAAAENRVELVDRAEAVDRWLLNRLGLPDKLWRRLRHEKGIELTGDRLRLALFPVVELGVIPRWYDLMVLYEDDFCLVVHKPAGMAVHPDGGVKDGPLTLDHAVASYYEINDIHTAVRHVHRLDVDTTGPVLYAKNEFALLKLDEQMRAKDIDRRYVALVRGKVPRSLRTLDWPIGKDRHHKQRRRVSPTGQKAVTHVEVGEVWGSGPSAVSLVYLTLETGRTHQIRVHLSHAGYPLLGDVLYGGRAADFGRQALHGERLTFCHPLSGETIHVEDAWPDDFQKLYKQL
ncbi:RNA pseudouridine synthase [Paenibacillus jamilae]|uniref:RluA family pseudouridine synthase n=1 Tax=Paenibacillus jamilae TaxID=114136 RepID=UPI0007AB27C4|nr:RluA family pseudouridine synthase [Paenibacillus jamilae]KZE67623.1 RNA pseudouridine synthase [Paenibacillus jamilae]